MKHTREKLTPAQIHQQALYEIAAERQVKNAITTHMPKWLNKHRQETDYEGPLTFAIMLGHHANDNFNYFRPLDFFVYRYRDVSPTVVFQHYKQSALAEMSQLLHRNIIEKMPQIGKKTELITALDVGRDLKHVALLVDITHPHVKATFIAACKFQVREFARTTWYGRLPAATYWLFTVPTDRREPCVTSLLRLDRNQHDRNDDREIIEPTIESVHFHEVHGPLGPRWQTRNW